ncbi:MAG: T9SS type A sorting domain-containing protein [Bacteroidetes bacterium]|nr:T9SS type A sorting domain-containing protein [Bacteroidota bacterium]
MNLNAGNEGGSIIVNDMAGRRVIKQPVAAGTPSVKVSSSELSKGVYLVHFESDNNFSKPVKLVIE